METTEMIYLALVVALTIGGILLRNWGKEKPPKDGQSTPSGEARI